MQKKEKMAGYLNGRAISIDKASSCGARIETNQLGLIIEGRPYHSSFSPALTQQHYGEGLWGFIEQRGLGLG